MSYQFAADHREYIKREYEARLMRRPLYSQRALARDIGVAPSTLTDFLKGRIGFSPGRIAQISKKLALTHEQKEHWKDLVETQFNRDLEKRKISLLRVKARLESQKNSLSVEQFKVISDWYHLAYLELITINSKKYSDMKVAAKALGISAVILKKAVNRLIDEKFITKSESGYFAVNPKDNIGDNTSSEAIRRFHYQILQKAQVALETQSMKRRFNTSMIVGLPPDKVSQIIAELESLALKLIEPHLVNVTNEQREKLYCLNINFFDLMQTAGEKS